MWHIVLGAWTVAGVLTAGVLTGVVQNSPPALAQPPQERQSEAGATERESGTAAEPGVAEDRDDLGIQFRMSNSGQLMISLVDRRSSAAAAGLRQGDIVVSVAGRTFSTEPALREFLVRLSSEDRIPVVVMRDGRQQTALWVLDQEQPFDAESAERRETQTADRRESRGALRGRVREHRAARPDFDLAERVERMEGEIESLRGEVRDLRQRLTAITPRQPEHEQDHSVRPDPEDVNQGLLEPDGEPESARGASPELREEG